MNKKVVLVILVSTLLTTLLYALTLPGETNPIPVPTLLMPEEYINASIFDSDGAVVARVDEHTRFST